MTDGEKYCTEKQPVILCILCSVNHNPPPLITADHSPPLKAANHSEYDQFCTLDVVKKSENETEQWKRNTKYQNREIQRKNWGGASGQTGGARVDKLGGHLDLL